jgi:elongation factor G
MWKRSFHYNNWFAEPDTTALLASRRGLLTDLLLSLVYLLLYLLPRHRDAGELSRLGTVNDGTTTLDYDPDEVKRKISINTALGFCEWKRHRLILVDTPGAANFIADTYGALHVMDAALVLISAESGVKAQTERVWQWVEQYKLACLVVMNEMDHERANFAQSLAIAQKAFNNKLVPVQVPFGEGANFQGVIDLIHLRAYTYRNDTSGAVEETAIPEAQQETVHHYRNQLIERSFNVCAILA